MRQTAHNTLTATTLQRRKHRAHTMVRSFLEKSNTSSLSSRRMAMLFSHL